MAPRGASPTPSGSRTKRTLVVTMKPREIKVPILEYFDSNKNKLVEFLVQVELYIAFN